ncbi:MAG: hypothetical protein MZU79_07250 [Anaerotruncus sp.]|nr:hypothetical protein [Anaerotruncus sp.]
MTGLAGEATFAVLAQGAALARGRPTPPAAGSSATSDDFLADLRAMVESKTAGSVHPLRHLPGPGHAGHLRHPGAVDLPPPPRDGHAHGPGLHPGKVIGLFTLEGMLNGVLAALVAAAYGIPLLTWMARTGWALPGDTDSYGFAIGERLFPSYGAGLVAGTTLIVLLTTTVVSFLPTRQHRQAQADRRAEGADDMIRFLLKGLLRDRSRSLLPFLTVVLGSMLTVVGFSWLNGAISTIVESSASFSAGHVKVMSRAYAAGSRPGPERPGPRRHPRPSHGAPRATIPASSGRRASSSAASSTSPTRRARPGPRARPPAWPSTCARPRAPSAASSTWTRPSSAAACPSARARSSSATAFATRLGVGPGVDGDPHRRDHVRRHGRPELHRLRHAPLRHQRPWTGARSWPTSPTSRRPWTWRTRPARSSVSIATRSTGTRRPRSVAAAFNDAHARRRRRVRARDGHAPRTRAAGPDARLRLGHLLAHARPLHPGHVHRPVERRADGQPAPLRRVRHPPGPRRGPRAGSTGRSSPRGRSSAFSARPSGTALGPGHLVLSPERRASTSAAMLKNASMIITDVLRARVTPASYVIGFVPGLAATFLGKAVSGIGIYKRQTSRLAKEFES